MRIKVLWNVFIEWCSWLLYTKSRAPGLKDNAEKFFISIMAILRTTQKSGRNIRPPENRRQVAKMTNNMLYPKNGERKLRSVSLSYDNFERKTKWSLLQCLYRQWTCIADAVGIPWGPDLVLYDVNEIVLWLACSSFLKICVYSSDVDPELPALRWTSYHPCIAFTGKIFPMHDDESIECFTHQQP